MRRFVSRSRFLVNMHHSKRRESLPRILVQGLVVVLVLSTTQAQWLSFKSSRNPKSNLWFPNMPAPKALQQRSSVGSSIRGLGNSSPSSSSSSTLSNSQNSGSNNFNANSKQNQSPDQGPRTRPIGYRSVGQPTYQTVHGGIISRQESVYVHPRNSNPQDSNRGGYGSSSRQNSQSQNRPHQSQNSRNTNNQFMHRSGQQQSWNHYQNPSGKLSSSAAAPTVVTAKHLSINLNNQSPRNKLNLNVGPAATIQNPSGYTSSRRLLEVGRSGQVDFSSTPTRRPVTQIAGALQDSWPNSNAHHHLSPVMKNQKVSGPTNRNYYEAPQEGTGGWGSQIRVSDQAIEIKNTYTKPKSNSVEQKSFNDRPVDRQLSVPTGREKLVSNTLNTLAKLSPKKPIFVYLRVEGIAAINSGAEAGDVIKKLAGGSKLPFYNGTKSLPKENMPQVFLAPEDMPPPTNYGKIPIPNLRPKETATLKPTFTKILLPGGTRMTSHLSSQPHTTTTTTPPPTSFPFVHSTAHSMINQQIISTRGPPMSSETLSLDEKIKILQMFQNQAESALAQQAQQQQGIYPQPYSTQASPSQAPYSQAPYSQAPYSQAPYSQAPYSQAPPSQAPPSHNEILRGVLPHGAVLESITSMDGNPPGLNSFPGIPEQAHNSIMPGQQFQDSKNLPKVGNVGDTNIKDLLGSIIESAVSKTVGEMLPTLTPHQPGRLGQPPVMQHHHYQNQQFQQPMPTQNYAYPQHAMGQGQNVVQFINGHPSQFGQPQMQWMQSKMDNEPTVFVNGPNPSQQPNQPPPSGSLGRPPHPHGPSTPKPPRPNPLKNALSLLGIQSTPRPEPSTRAPQFMTTPRSFHTRPGQPQPNMPPHGPFSGPPQGHPNNFGSPAPPPRVQHGPPPPHPHRPPFPSRDDDPSIGSGESHNLKRPAQTIIVQTPDKSQPNQKSTFVISGGGGNNLPDLQKIMKVLNDMNGDQNQHHPNSASPSPFPPQPTRPPFPSSTTPPPTRMPTMFPFNFNGHPGPTPQQPQVVIRHPSGTPTQGPFIVTTGKPNGVQFVSTTFQPGGQSAGPTTPRPHFVSSTGAPMYIGPSPSSSPIQIIKAISHPELQQPLIHHQHQSHSVQPMVPKPNIIYQSASPSPQPKIVTINTNQLNINKPAASPSPSTKPQQQVNPSKQTFSGSGETPAKVIEVDPGLSPEEIQKSIMDSIMKHQKEVHGGISNGPIVINAHPSMASALGNSPHFMHVKSSPSPQSANATSSSSTKVPFTVQPAIESSPTRSSPTSNESNGSGSFEKQRNKFGSSEKSKIHHHSKEVSDEKPYKKNKGDSISSVERYSKNRDQSSEEKVIEKVITEEKIVWNPGPGDGEMIPSRIKTEERIILRPHGVLKSSENIKKSESGSGSIERKSSSEIFKSTFKKDDEENKSEDKSANSDNSNFAGLLRSKLKFERMKEQLHLKKQMVAQEATNPFSRYLHPSSPSAPPTTASTSPLTSPDQTLISSVSPMSDNGRFKIRPGDISKTEYQGPVYGVTPTGQPILVSPTMPTHTASPSPSAFPPYEPSPSSPSYIGPSPSSFPMTPQPTAGSFPVVSSTLASEIRAMPTGTKDEKLLFVPADTFTSPSMNVGVVSPPGPTIQTKNGQNQTVMFTTMNQLPDLMSQLSGTKTEVRMIDDLSKFQQTLAKVQATQASSTMSPNQQQQQQNVQPTHPAQRRMDVISDEKPFTWRPNGTIPSPTLESLRQRFPSGLGANVLHAVSAGFAANDIKPKWTQNVNGQAQQQQQPQILYTMANGVPVPINSIGGYQPFILQGTKEPMLAYYGYNWNNNGGDLLGMSSTVRPTEVTVEPKYTSRFRGSAPSLDDTQSNNPIYPTAGKVKPPSPTTRDPLDPLSEELEANDHSNKKNKGNKKNEETPKSSRRRRPGVFKDEDDEDKTSENNQSQDDDESSEEVANKRKVSKNRPQSVTPNILSRRIDESDEKPVMLKNKSKVQVQKDMFVNSGESKPEDNIKPTSKLPILLAPSIISRKSVVSQTGSSFIESKIAPKPTASSIATKNTQTTMQLTSAVSKLLSTIAPTKSTSSKTGEEDLKETQAELKSLLKKLQQKLSRDDVYELGEFYDYYDELQQVPSTKATTTTTTKGTKKPVSKKTKKSKNTKKSKTKKSSKKSKKSKTKSGKKSTKTTKKPKTKITTTTMSTTTTTTTTTTTPKPMIVTSSTLLTNPTTVTPNLLKHNRHPISSIESLTSMSLPTISTTTQQVFSDQSNNNHNNAPSGESVSIEPQQYLQPRPISNEVPTNPPNSEIAFVYPQVEYTKDRVASRTHYRQRPLWVRKKSPNGSGESLEPVGQPNESNGKVIRLVRRKRPGMRRRPVFVQQSLEIDQNPSPSTPYEYERSSFAPQQESTTATIPVDILFENNNELGKRVGVPDSMERSQQNVTKKIGGKRKLKLIRLKGQRAQWRLKMNDDEQGAVSDINDLPQASQLVSITNNVFNPQQTEAVQLPQAIPLSSTNPEVVQPNLDNVDRESRQESFGSGSIEAKVCIQGKCEMITKQ